MPTAIEQTYIEIGRLYVESLSFAERVHEYLEILEFAEFSDVVDFAASSGKARKKPTCTPGKSQLCGGACVSLKKQCRQNATGAEKTAGTFIADHVQARKGRGAKVAGSTKPKTSGAAEAGMNLAKTMTKVRAEAEKAKPVETAASSKPATAAKSKAKKAENAQPDSKAKLFDDVKALELQADVLKKNPASGGIIDRLTVVADSLKRNALREDLKSGAVSMGVISQLAGGANDRNPALASASDRVVAEAYKQIPTSTKNRLATKRGEFLVEADFPAGSETAKVQADLRARRDRIRSGAR
jgi:hypothetical protein